jgi:hypothetical protein
MTYDRFNRSAEIAAGYRQQSRDGIRPMDDSPLITFYLPQNPLYLKERATLAGNYRAARIATETSGTLKLAWQGDDGLRILRNFSSR